MADLYGVDVRTVSYHLRAIYESGELKEEATIRKIGIVQSEGEREVNRPQMLYNHTIRLIVNMMPPLDTLFGVRNRKAISFLEKINKNLVLATKDPVMDYDELNISRYRRPDYLE